MTVKRAAILFCLGFVFLFPRAGQAQDALPFAKSYSITGNYVVGGVDLPPQSQAGGFVTGTLPMSGIPANADILAAFLYWETISTVDAQAFGAKFRGSPITAVKATSVQRNSSTSSCWSSGGGSGAVYTLTMFRADVLGLTASRLLNPERAPTTSLREL